MYHKIIHTLSAAETEATGAELAIAMQREGLPPYVALYGDLGVGKTAFVRGFASVIAPTAPVRSPTFALVNEYRGRDKRLFHFDMYRITSEDDLYSIGYDDYLTAGGICLVEWSENIENDIPPRHVRVEIVKNDANSPDSRLITIEERR
ncbi:MAG: tRNA (adenosine(37)-N6)-threonylcarbamoyltransferase complex ATPase subunit type 1 TsaE [Ruminococcaceae bacterium]|nr:tRNA (adenosine(37)-N6)-threonylcarbamoyltransferase complex ATPase subunit type 1 TsaE [Oscillospiraceae bacterium]